MHSNTRFEDCVERWFCWPILSPTIAASDLCDTWIDNQAPDKYPMIFMGGLFLLPMVIWGFTIECFLRTSRRQRIWLLLALLVLAVWMGRTLPNSAPLSEAAHVSRERVVGVQMAGAWVVFLSVGFFMVASNKRNQRLRNR